MTLIKLLYENYLHPYPPRWRGVASPQRAAKLRLQNQRFCLLRSKGKGGFSNPALATSMK